MKTRTDRAKLSNGCLRAITSTIAIAFLAPLLSPTASAGVGSWSSQGLIYQPPASTYSYAAAVILDGSTEHMYTCQNQTAGVITDSIHYVKRVSGSIVESTFVLSPGGAGAWDHYNVCDPSIIKGSFLMSGTTYQYALFYTGNDRGGSLNNQIGVAFSNSLDGGWTKYPYPLIFNTDGTSAWGAGQPSVTSVNGVGDVLIFYTDGSLTLTQGKVAHLDMSNMGNIVTYFYKSVTNSGLTFSDGSSGDYLNNFHVVYDPSRDRFYAIREQHPYPTNFPTWLPRNQQIVSIPGSNIWSGNGTWTVEGALTSAITGFPRNHNAGIKRGYYGTLLEPSTLRVVFDKSCEDTGNGACSWPGVLWGYYVYEIIGAIT
jgi:hypothetical protein